MDGPAATDEMVREWLHDLVEDDPEALVFWLALAATQSKVGRLEDRVRDKAVDIIDNHNVLPITDSVREDLNVIFNKAEQKKQVDKAAV